MDTIGKLIDATAQRDAIHVAIAPVTAGAAMAPGAHVGLFEYGTVAPSKNPIGIIDPFLRQSVKTGQRCYLFLYPNTVTSLRHEWTHPAFQPVAPRERSASEQWLRDLADRVDIGYNRLLEGAEAWVESRQSGASQWGGEHIVGGSEMEGETVPEEFWQHYENVTGKKVDEAHRGSFFSCSC